MKKIPIQITDENVKFLNESNISFAKFLNNCIEQFRELELTKNEIKIMIEAGVDFSEIFKED
jgi:hypothetical protein